MIESDDSGRRYETLGGDVFLIDVDVSKLDRPKRSPEEIVRSAPTSLLRRVIEAGTFRPIWVQLAREELARRGVPPTP
jgi:hypothetical protein